MNNGMKVCKSSIFGMIFASNDKQRRYYVVLKICSLTIVGSFFAEQEHRIAPY